jgi:molybdate transport system regulatory protein
VELRLLISGAVVIGPVQAVLLEEIRRTGSISAAGRRMGVSYIYVMEAVPAMNETFSRPLVDLVRGGPKVEEQA